jgi:hypothetical protein
MLNRNLNAFPFLHVHNPADSKKAENKIEEVVERIVAMAKVLFGLHMVNFATHKHTKIVQRL